MTRLELPKTTHVVDGKEASFESLTAFSKKYRELSQSSQLYETNISKTSPWIHTTATGEVLMGKVTVECDETGKPINRRWKPRNEKEIIRAMHWDDLYQELLEEYEVKNKIILDQSRATKKLRRANMIKALAAKADADFAGKTYSFGMALPNDENPSSPVSSPPSLLTRDRYDESGESQ